MSTTHPFGLGRLQEHDPRSRGFSVAAVLSVAPELANRTWPCGPVLDQGVTSQCVGFSRTADLLALPSRARIEDPQGFAAALYHEAQTLDQWPGEEPAYEGSSVLAGLKAAVARGFVGTYHWAFGMADMLRALSELGPVVVGTDWLASMFEPNERGVLTVDPSSGVAGGHAYLVRGVVVTEASKRRIVGAKANRPGDQLLRIRNSWGRSWGRDGDAYLWASDYAAYLYPGGEQSVVTTALRQA